MQSVEDNREISLSNLVFPYFTEGTVVKGFGRGGKQLGTPTANYAESVVDDLPDSITCGVYYGWAQVEWQTVMPMVMSIGTNPFFKNKRKTMETHIIHKFEEDFYGSNLKVCLLGYIRPQSDFTSIDDLINAIKDDISTAEEKLQHKQNLNYKSNKYFNRDGS